MALSKPGPSRGDRGEPPAAKKTKLSLKKQYTYSNLRELRPDMERANLMGVISLFRPPYQSRGTDYTCTVELVDESNTSQAFPCIFFNQDSNKLPSDCNVGDVICLRRVELCVFNKKLQGKCRRFCSWHYWSREGEGDEVRPPTGSSEGSTWDPEEAERANDLLKWNISQLDSQLSESYTPTSQPSLQTVKPITSITLADRKINFVGVMKSQTPPQKSKGSDYFTTAILIDETSPTDGFPFTFFSALQNRLPQLGAPGTVVYLQNIKLSMYEDALVGRGYQHAKAVCLPVEVDGSVKAPSCYEVHFEVLHRAEALYEWVSSADPLAEDEAETYTEENIPNVACQPSSVPPSPTHSSSSSPAQPRPAPPALPSSPQPAPPALISPPRPAPPALPSYPLAPTPLTLTFHSMCESQTLADIKSSSIIPSFFHTRVKLLKVLQPLHTICQLRCSQCKYLFPSELGAGHECTNCAENEATSDSPKLQFVFCLSLLVCDSTEQLSLHLSDSDAEEFFGSLKPTDFAKIPSTKNTLQTILNFLAGGEDPFLSPSSSTSSISPSSSSSSSSSSLPSYRPWFDCIVLSYPSSKGTQYRITSTVLCPSTVFRSCKIYI